MFARFRLSLVASVCLVAPALTVATYAADLLPPQSDGWTFTVAPYLWGAGLSGDVGVLGQGPVGIDFGIGDILPDLKFAAMGAAEAHNGTWGVLTDVMYVHVRPEEQISRIVLGVPVTLNASVDTTSFSGAVFGEYRILDNGSTTVDALAGLRYWQIDGSVSAHLLAGGSEIAKFSGSDGVSWVDPMIGAKLHMNISERFYATGWGMIGGASVGSRLAWDAMGGVGYRWTEHFSTVAGYRAVGVDYRHKGFVYDTVQKGPFLGGVYRF